jgi:hypothetical protein
MKKTSLIAALVLTLIPALAPAGTIKFPEEKPAVSFNIPDSWEPESDEDGVLAESPDNVATIYLQVIESEDDMKAAVEDNMKWLIEEHDVKVDEATQEEKEFKTGEREWKVISWSAESKEWGPASVGFLFSEAGEGKALTITYWISKKDSDKSMEGLTKIFESVKTLK